MLGVTLKALFVGICTATILIATVMLFNWGASGTSLLLCREADSGLDDAYDCGYALFFHALSV